MNEPKKTIGQKLGAAVGSTVSCWTVCNVVLKCEGVVDMTWVQAFAPTIWLLVVCLFLLGVISLAGRN